MEKDVKLNPEDGKPLAVAAAQLADWQSKFKGVKCIAIESMSTSGLKLYAYIRKPDKAHISLSTDFVMKGNLAKSRQTLVTNCLLYASPELTTEGPNKDEYMFAIGTKIGELFQVPEAEEVEI